MSYAELWQSMGLFAKGIVVVMFIMSAWSWAVSISKQIYLRKSQKETRKFAPEFSRYLQEEQLDGAIALAEKNKKSHVARVLGEALAEVKPLLRDRATITAADINSAERAVERQMLIITAELKRGLGILATTGATAPFVGLLGLAGGDHRRRRRSADYHGVRSARRDSGGVALQLLQHQDRLPHGGNDLHVEGADRLSHQERRQRIRPVDLHQGIPDPEDVADQRPNQGIAANGDRGSEENRRRGRGEHQRHADDRRDAGAADHLHDRDARDHGGFPGDHSACQEPRVARGSRR
jgi:hypothetical protein